MTTNNDHKNKEDFTQPLAHIDTKQIQQRETCAAGEGWMAEVKKGQTLRIIDSKGNQAVDTLFISCADIAERYSATDTLAQNQKLFLGMGSQLFTNRGRVIASITEDTCGRHDTLGGACSCESNTVRYAHETYPMHSCRNNFMHTVTTHPIAPNDVPRHKRLLARPHSTPNAYRYHRRLRCS